MSVPIRPALALARGLQLRRNVVADLDAGVLQVVARVLEACPGHADGHAGHERTGVVEGLHDA
jgi:hypothetical protein